jgi:hypothetical protein
MIDTKNPCAGSSNWKAGNNSTGGTPGRKNSIDAINNDQTPPRLKNAYSTDSITIILVFDEPLDSLKAATSSNYAMDGGITIIGATSLSPLFNQVELRLNPTLMAKHGLFCYSQW